MLTLSNFGPGWKVVAVLVGFAFVAGCAFVIRMLFASRSEQMTSQRQAPTSQQPYPTVFIIAIEATKVASALPEGFLFDKSVKVKVTFSPEHSPTLQQPYWGLRIFERDLQTSGSLSWIYIYMLERVNSFALGMKTGNQITLV